MKKIKLFFVTIPLAILLLSNNSLAEEPPNVLFCPEKIECTKDKNIGSCKIIGEHLEQWGNLEADGTIKKGTYFFNYAESTYQQPYVHDSGLQCNYSYVDYYNGISINIRSVNWDVASTEGTKWMIRGYRTYCNWQGAEHTTDPKNCPAELIPLVKIKSSSMYYPIFAYANGILLDNYLDSSERTEIVLYKAWDSCSDTGLCTIELMATINQTLVNVGSIVVDMDSRMKIIQIHSIAGFEMSLDAKDNGIEIKASS